MSRLRAQNVPFDGATRRVSKYPEVFLLLFLGSCLFNWMGLRFKGVAHCLSCNHLSVPLGCFTRLRDFS